MTARATTGHFAGGVGRLLGSGICLASDCRWQKWIGRVQEHLTSMTSLSLTSSSARYAEERGERTLTANSALDMPRPGLSMAGMDRACPGTPDKYDVTVADVIVRALRGAWAERTLTTNSALDMPRLGLSMAEMDRACPGAPDTYDVTVADVIARALRGGMGRANFDDE